MNEEKWRNAILWVFDAPDLGMVPFEARIFNLNFFLIVAGKSCAFAQIER
jgi:hypothetical protein